MFDSIMKNKLKKKISIFSYVMKNKLENNLLIFFIFFQVYKKNEK
jgi:hypothetical protein